MRGTVRSGGDGPVSDESPRGGVANPVPWGALLSPSGALVPEELARWLAIAYTAPIARLMAAAEMPPAIDSVDVSCEGYPVDDDYIPVGTTVDVSITASNCAEIHVLVPGAPPSIRLRAPEPYQPTQTHRFSFVVTVSGPIVVTAVNPLGEALGTQPPCPWLRVLQPPEFEPISFGEPAYPGMDDESVWQLAATLGRHGTHRVDFDGPTVARESLTISAAVRDSIADVSGFRSGWAMRLRDMLALHPRLGAEAARTVQFARTAPDVVGVPRHVEALWVPAVPRTVAVARPSRRLRLR